MIRRNMPALFSVLLAAAALLAAAPPSSGRGGRVASDDRLFFAMQIADETGAVIAEPKLLGMPGVPLRMNLLEPGEESRSRMSLWLQPEARGDGSFDVTFEITVPGKLAGGKGHMTLRSGEEKSASFAYPGGHLELQLVAFAVPSPEFDLYLQHGIRLLDRTRQT